MRDRGQLGPREGFGWLAPSTSSPCRGAVLSAETFVVASYGSSVDTLARKVFDHVTHIRSACPYDREGAERRLGELEALLEFEQPNRRRSVSVRFFLRWLSNMVQAGLLALYMWLWIVQILREDAAFTLASVTLDVAATASTLLMIITLLLAIVGVAWLRRWQAQIEQQKELAQRLLDPSRDSSTDSQSARWVGRRDIGPLVTLLALRLSDGSAIARWRFRLKLLTHPHLAVGDHVIVGLVPVPVWARCVCSVLTLAAALSSPTGGAVSLERLPIGLRWLKRNWRVVNLAASDSPRRPGAALALGRVLLELADGHGAVLRASARKDDPRLIPAYLAHGFEVVPASTSTQTVEVVRQLCAGRNDALSATRRLYEKYPFVEGGDHRVRHWVGRLSPLLPADILVGRRVLDVGCGSGEASLGLLARGARPVGLDLTWSAVQRLKHREPRVPVIEGDALALPFTNASFEHVLAIGVLHHTPDWRKALREAARVVRPGGRVVIMMYAARTPYHLLWTCATLLRTRLPVHSLERLPRWFMTTMRLIVAAQVGQRLSDTQLRRLLADQLWTPVVTFLSRRDLDAHAEAVGLIAIARSPLLWHAHLVAYERPVR